MKKLLWIVPLLAGPNCLAQDYRYDYQYMPQQAIPTPVNPTINNENKTSYVYYEPRSYEIDQQEAYSRYLDNKVKSVDTYWQIYDIYKERQKEKHKKIQEKRAAYLEKHRFQPFNESEYERSVGTINWPQELMQEQYVKYRTTFDFLMNKRAYSGLTMEEHIQLKQTSKEWRALLASQKEYYPKAIVSNMIRFILKIDRELNNV